MPDTLTWIVVPGGGAGNSTGRVHYRAVEPVRVVTYISHVDGRFF